MVSFSADYSNFKNSYEKKIDGKKTWVAENRNLVYKHFKRLFPGLNIDIDQFKTEELFVINTPTLYMYLGQVKTICFFSLEQFMIDGYQLPSLVLNIRNGHKLTIKIKSFPYL
jgi:hypothetical protein